MLAYYNGSPWTHGQTFGIDGVGTTWGKNHGIGAVRYRKDGFVAVKAPSVFQVTEPAGWPGFTTQVRHTLDAFRVLFGSCRGD